MGSARALGLLLCAVLGTGCAHNAYNQSVNLVAKDQQLLRPSRVTVVDARSAPEKETRTVAGPGGSVCARVYGDSYIVPSKQEYLVHLLASMSSEKETLNVSLTKFETTEYCEAMASRVTGGAVAGIVSAVTNAPSVVSQPALEHGDVFVVRVAGTVNGKDFDVTRAFAYSDISYMNFPSESAAYRERMASAMTQVAGDIVAVAAR